MSSNMFSLALKNAKVDTAKQRSDYVMLFAKKSYSLNYKMHYAQVIGMYMASIYFLAYTLKYQSLKIWQLPLCSIFKAYDVCI